MALMDVPELATPTPLGVRNTEVEEFLALIWEAEQRLGHVAPESLVIQLVEYAALVGDSPLAYHLGNALTSLAAVSPVDLKGPRLPGCNENSNFWSISIGSPGASHKTSAQKHVADILSEGAEALICRDVGSWEGFCDDMQDSGGRQCLVVADLGQFLSKTGPQGHLQEVRPAFTSAFDGDPITSRTRKNGVFRLMKPRLSFMGCVNNGFLEAKTEPSDWTGGFMSRFFIMASADYRKDPVVDPAQRDQARAGALETLHFLRQQVVGPCVGFTANADKLWRAYLEATKARDDGSFTRDAVVAAHARAATVAMRLILLLAFDLGVARGGKPWIVPSFLVKAAIFIAQVHRREAVELTKSVSNDEAIRNRNLTAKVLTFYADWVPLATVLRADTGTGLPLKALETALGHLNAEGTIEHRSITGGLQYRMKGLAAPAAPRTTDVLFKSKVKR